MPGMTKECRDGFDKWNREQQRLLREEYENNPKLCKYCGEPIPLGNQRPCEVKKNKFCSKSCAAKHNNVGNDRWRKYREKKPPTPTLARTKSGKLASYTNEVSGPCGKCGDIVEYVAIKNGRGYVKRHFCPTCLLQVKSEKAKLNHGENALPKPIVEMTKGDIKNLKSYHATKALITKHARKTYKESGRPMKCFICDYSVYVEICHKRDVADFPADATIGEINDPGNLEALCANHHKEFDKGLIKISEEARERFQDTILAWAKKIRAEKSSSDNLIEETLDLLRELKERKAT